MLAEHGFSPTDCALYREAEIAAELACRYPVPEIAKAYGQAVATGKVIVFLSDMYLPTEVVARMLRICGYETTNTCASPAKPAEPKRMAGCSMTLPPA